MTDDRSREVRDALRGLNEPPAMDRDRLFEAVRRRRASETRRRRFGVATAALLAAALLAVVVRMPSDPGASEMAVDRLEADPGLARAVAELEASVRTRVRGLGPAERASVETDLALIDGVVAELEGFRPATDAERALALEQLDRALEDKLRALREADARITPSGT